MSEVNTRLLILMVGMVALIGMNVAAAALKVPLGTASIADAVGGVTVLAAWAAHQLKP